MMKGIYLVVVLLLASNLQLLKTDEEAEGGGEEASPEVAAPEGATTEAPAAKGHTTKGPGSAITIEKKPLSEIKVPVPKIDKEKLKQTMSNLTKYLDAENKDTQDMVMKMSKAFGSQISSIAGCLGPEWFKKCRYEILKCTVNPAPPMCLWNLGCDSSPSRCDKKAKTTTPATTLSPRRALLRSAMKAAGLSCDKLKSCLGKGAIKLLGGFNNTMLSMKDKLAEAQANLKLTTNKP